MSRDDKINKVQEIMNKIDDSTSQKKIEENKIDFRTLAYQLDRFRYDENYTNPVTLKVGGVHLQLKLSFDDSGGRPGFHYFEIVEPTE